MPDLFSLPALLAAACALTGVFLFARLVANARVAAASVLCVGFYPVFVGALNAVAVMAATALTIWGLFFYFPPRLRPGSEDAGQPDLLKEPAAQLKGPRVRRAACVLLLALACLARETAVITALTLCIWELLGHLARRGRASAALSLDNRGRTVALALSLLLAPLPLVAFRLFGAEGAVGVFDGFGGPRAGDAGGAAAYFAAVFGHLKHFTIDEGLWALTLAGVAAMFLPPRRDGETARPRIAVPVQLTFAALVCAHVLLLPLFGADTARDALPLLPPVILIWVSTLWRRVTLWPFVVALVCALFALRIG